HHPGDDQITGDIAHGASHVQQSIDTGHQRHRPHGQTHRGGDHGQHQQPRTRNPGGTDGSQHTDEHNREELARAQTHTGDIGHEHGGRPHIDGGAVHVDGGTQGKAEPVHTLVHAQFFGGGGGHRQGAVAGGGDTGGEHRALHRSEEVYEPA